MSPTARNAAQSAVGFLGFKARVGFKIGPGLFSGCRRHLGAVVLESSSPRQGGHWQCLKGRQVRLSRQRGICILQTELRSSTRYSSPRLNLPNYPRISYCSRSILCLTEESRTESASAWSLPVPLPPAGYGDEQSFRDVNVRGQDLISAVKALGADLGKSDLVQKQQEIIADATQFENDANIFLSNVKAAQDAIRLSFEINEVFRRGLLRQQMRAALSTKLKAIPTDLKPILDDAELNDLLDRYDESHVKYRKVASERWNQLMVKTLEFIPTACCLRRCPKQGGRSRQASFPIGLGACSS